jgi:AcrR family transcriptional regulator
MARAKKSAAAVGRADSDTGLRERILNAAFGAFVERGYAGTSTLEIATRARVSKRELYALFKSKEAMLIAGITARTARMGAAAELPEARDRATLGEILADFGTRLLHEASHPHVIAVYRLAMGEYARAPEIAHTLHSVGREGIRNTLTKGIARAQAAGLLRKGDSGVLASWFLGLLWHDHFVNLLLGAETQPSEAECRRRARVAATEFLDLNAPPRG